MRQGGRRLLRALAWTAGVASLLVLALFALVDLFFNSWCGNQVIQKVVAPDERHTVFLFQRDCGATTGFSTQISLYPRDADKNLPNSAGNVFIAEEKGNGPKGYWHGPLVRTRWLDGNKLEIRYHHTARTFYRQTRLGIVQIKYVVD